MSGGATPGFDEREYRGLVAAFPPRPIRTEEQLAATEAQIERLLGQQDLSPAELEYLDLLGTLVRDWEDEHVEIPDASPVEVLRFLLEQNGLSEQDLLSIFGTRSLVTDVLAGRSPLQVSHIEQLAHRFRVSPSAFFAAHHHRRAA